MQSSGGPRRTEVEHTGTTLMGVARTPLARLRFEGSLRVEGAPGASAASIGLQATWRTELDGELDQVLEQLDQADRRVGSGR